MNIAAEQKTISNAAQAATVFRSILAMRAEEDRHKECFYVMGLDAANTVLFVDLVGMGTINQAQVYVREVFRWAIVKNTAGIIICHNHPSGKVEPSPQDKTLTQRTVNAGKILDVNVLDHIIIGGQSHYSFADSGMLN